MGEAAQRRSTATLTQELTLWFAGAFLTLGWFGLLPGVTKNLDTLALGRSESDAMLFGIFAVSMTHNVVHLALGTVALLLAGSDRHARAFLLTAGIALMLMVIYGQLDNDPALGDLVPVSDADAWLHTILALAMFLAAVVSPKKQLTNVS